MPAAIVLPMAAAMPNHMPRTCSNRPRLCTVALLALEDESAVVDNRNPDVTQEPPSYWRLQKLQAGMMCERRGKQLLPRSVCWE